MSMPYSTLTKLSKRFSCKNFHWKLLLAGKLLVSRIWQLILRLFINGPINREKAKKKKKRAKKGTTGVTLCFQCISTFSLVICYISCASIFKQISKTKRNNSIYLTLKVNCTATLEMYISCNHFMFYFFSWLRGNCPLKIENSTDLLTSIEKKQF